MKYCVNMKGKKQKKKLASLPSHCKLMWFNEDTLGEQLSILDSLPYRCLTGSPTYLQACNISQQNAPHEGKISPSISTDKSLLPPSFNFQGPDKEHVPHSKQRRLTDSLCSIANTDVHITPSKTLFFSRIDPSAIVFA